MRERKEKIALTCHSELARRRPSALHPWWNTQDFRQRPNQGKIRGRAGAIFGNWVTLKPGATTGTFKSCATGGTPLSGTGAAGASDIRGR